MNKLAIKDCHRVLESGLADVDDLNDVTIPAHCLADLVECRLAGDIGNEPSRAIHFTGEEL